MDLSIDKMEEEDLEKEEMEEEQEEENVEEEQEEVEEDIEEEIQEENEDIVLDEEDFGDAKVNFIPELTNVKDNSEDNSQENSQGENLYYEEPYVNDENNNNLTESDTQQPENQYTYIKKKTQDFENSQKENEIYPPALDEEQLQILGETYQTMTSKLYEPDKDGYYPTEKHMMESLNELREFLSYEAERYNLLGVVKEIHNTIVLEDLDDFSIEDLTAYIEVFKFDVEPRILKKGIHLEIATNLYIHIRRRLERFREYKYMAEIFFGDANDRQYYFDNVPYFQTIGEMDPSKILVRGPKFYFLRIGELTIDAIKSRFDFRETFQMLMMFRQMNWGRFDIRITEQLDVTWKLTNLTREDDVVRALIASIIDLNLDPRIWLVLDGPQSTILTEPNEYLLSIGDNFNAFKFHMKGAYENLLKCLTSEGISIRFNDNQENNTTQLKPLVLMFTEYTIAQLSPAFSSIYGEHRLLHEAVYNDQYTMKINDSTLIDDDDGVRLYFGKRDGFSKMFAYSVEELYKTFLEVGDFYDPISIVRYPTNAYMWYKFPRRTIIRLINVVLPHLYHKSPWVPKLTDICREILHKNKIALEINTNRLFVMKLQNQKEMSEETAKYIKMALHRIYNVGLQFVEWDEQIDHYDDDLVNMMTNQDPLFVAPETSMTGRVRYESQKLIMLMQDSIAQIGDEKVYFEGLFMVRPGPKGDSNLNTLDLTLDLGGGESREEELKDEVVVESDFGYESGRQAWFAQDLYLTYEDNAYTIGNYLETMHEMAKYNLTNVMKISGLWLMSTANVYHKLICGISLNTTKLELYETNPGYEETIGAL